MYDWGDSILNANKFLNFNSRCIMFSKACKTICDIRSVDIAEISGYVVSHYTTWLRTPYVANKDSEVSRIFVKSTFTAMRQRCGNDHIKTARARAKAILSCYAYYICLYFPSNYEGSKLWLQHGIDRIGQAEDIDGAYTKLREYIFGTHYD